MLQGNERGSDYGRESSMSFYGVCVYVHVLVACVYIHMYICGCVHMCWCLCRVELKFSVSLTLSNLIFEDRVFL